MKKYIKHHPTLNHFQIGFILMMGLITYLLPLASAKAAEHCSDKYYINETLPNGATWDMCWEARQREGIAFHHIFYTPKNGQRRMILNQASVAQIHVPYDDNGTRFHDISDYGIGGENLLDLLYHDCPGGKRFKHGENHILCQQIEKRGFSYKKGKDSTDGHTLVLFSVSPVAAYYYIPLWRFMDNGTIEPWLGATGALQRYGDNESSGWRLGEGRVGISHLHNFFWKLDFDLNGTAENDTVEEINFPLANGKRQRTTTLFKKEVARKVDPESMRRWRIKDGTTKNENGHSLSYDIVLSETGHQDIGPASEPFTHNDFYVTKQRDEEKFASHNTKGGKNLAEYTNDEDLTGQDIVLWTGVTFYHMPRSEDAPHMDAHWSHLQLIPRDWHTSNPLGKASTYNTPPAISSIENQVSKVGDIVNLPIKTTDVDNDILNYSVTNLPAGLSINKKTGLINGTLTTASNNTIQVSVSDNEESSTTDFTWKIEEVHINQPPKLTPPPNQTGLVGDSVHLSIKADDADNDHLTYSATNLPSGLQINPSTGVISGSLDLAGNFTTYVKVYDKSSHDSLPLTWSIIAPFVNKTAQNSILMDGKLNDWNDKVFFPTDPDDLAGKNNQIDWLKVAMAHSSNTVYLAYSNRENIDPTLTSGHYIPKGWQAYLDIDNKIETGYIIGDIGADYLIEGTSIQHYIGTSTSWAWEPKGLASIAYQGKTAEISFNRSIIKNPDKLRAIFIGNNHVFGSKQKDIYPNTGFFNYAFMGASISNTPPVANEQNITLGSGTSVSVILSATDIDDDALSYKSMSQPRHGSLSGSAPNLIYTANSDFTGTDSFTFSVNDSHADSPVATIHVEVTSKQTGLVISNAINKGFTLDGKTSDWEGLPSFPDDTNNTEDKERTINWQNVTLAHTNEKLYLLIRNRGNIDPVHSTGSYLPWTWQTFIDSDKNRITGYSVGGIGADFIIEGTHILQYTGKGNNWSWKSVDQALVHYDKNHAELSLSRSTLGNPASIRLLFRGHNNATKINQVDLYPNAQDDVTAISRYFEYDLKGHDNSSGRPEVFAQTVTMNTGSEVNINLIAIDPDNNHLTYLITSQPKNGVLSGTAPSLTYTPKTSFIGQDSFRFKVNDGNSDSTFATITINVAGAQEGGYSNIVSSMTIDGDYEDWSALTPFIEDIDSNTNDNNLINWHRAAMAHDQTFIYFMYQNHGLVSPDNNTGNYINRGWQTYLDTDGNASTGYKIGNIGADYFLEGAQLLKYTGTGESWSWNFKKRADLQYNANGVELSITKEALEKPNKIQVFFVGDNSDYNGDRDNYPEDKSSFSYLLNKKENSLTNTQRPIANSLAREIIHNTSTRINLAKTDIKTDKSTYQVIRQPIYGDIKNFISDGNLTYIPKTDYAGPDSFSYIINDGTYDSSIATVSLKILMNTSTKGGGGLFPVKLMLLVGILGLLRARRYFILENTNN